MLSTLASHMTAGSTDCTMRLLDAFSGAGALALRWASAFSKQFPGQSVHIVANDQSSHCAELIRENRDANHMPGQQLQVTNEDTNLLMSRCALQPSSGRFDAMHLDPFGCCTPFLDNAMRAVANGGVISLTSTDTSALFNRGYARVCLRHYGVRLNSQRGEHWRETAARIVLSAMAAAAARHDRGIEVLLVASCEHFVLCSCRVLRGKRRADACLENLRMLSGEGWGRESTPEQLGSQTIPGTEDFRILTRFPRRIRSWRGPSLERAALGCDAPAGHGGAGSGGPAPRAQQKLGEAGRAAGRGGGRPWRRRALPPRAPRGVGGRTGEDSEARLGGAVAARCGLRGSSYSSGTQRHSHRCHCGRA